MGAAIQAFVRSRKMPLSLGLWGGPQMINRSWGVCVRACVRVCVQVLGTFQAVVLQSREETELDSVLVFQLVSFLVDHHMDIMAVPADMKQSVEEKLRLLEKPQVCGRPSWLVCAWGMLRKFADFASGGKLFFSEMKERSLFWDCHASSPK